MRVVFKLGGSIAFPGEPDVKYIADFAKAARGLECAVVVGGGATCRKYVNSLRQHGLGEAFLDVVGIEIARVNARILARFIGGKYVETPEQAFNAIQSGRIPVLGGLSPGQSTDAVAAVVAEYIHADKLVVLTNVDGLYDKDPKKHKDAKLFKKMSFCGLLELCSGLESKAGDYPVFDYVAAKIVSRSKITTVICNGKSADLKDAIDGKTGTVIK